MNRRDDVARQRQWNRRHLLAGVGAAGILAVATGRLVLGQDGGLFTGPNQGLTVTWDPATWQFAYGTTVETYDWLTLVVATGPQGVPTANQQSTLFKVQMIEAPFADVAAAAAGIEGLYDTWIGDDTSHVLTRSDTDRGAGIAVVSDFYETVMWFEVGPAKAGGWRMTQLILPIADITPAYVGSLIVNLSIDGGPPFLAAKPYPIVTMMTSASSGQPSSTSVVTPPPTVAPTEAPPITATAVWIEKDAYTGSHLGVNVTWDHAVWRFSGDESTGAESYADDDPAFPEEDVLLIESLAIHMVTTAQISFWRGGWASLDGASVQGADAFAQAFPLSEIEQVGAWVSDVAAGFLLRFSDYSQKYIEFTQPVPGVWSLLRYSANYNSVDDLAGTAESLAGVWIEGQPMVRAVGVDELVATIAANA